METGDPPDAADGLCIWRICDGKPGHENQSLGLAEALSRRVPCTTHDIPATHTSALPARWRATLAAARDLPSPDLVVGAGHATHGPLCWLAMRRRARSVVLMRPSLPARFFDFVIAPAHDFPGGPPSGNPHILTTLGAINRVRPCHGPREDTTLVLLGGPSKHHGWDAAAMRAMVTTIASTRPAVELADSRRTPNGFFDSLRELPGIHATHPHRESGPGWLAGKLAACRDVWVSEDSVSMIHEALSGGARVGILPVPRLRPDARVCASVDLLAADRLVTRYQDWKPGDSPATTPNPFAEADRAATWLFERTGWPL